MYLKLLKRYLYITLNYSTVMLIMLTISSNLTYKCTAQNHDIENLNLIETSNCFKLKETDTNSHPTVLSLGMGASTYKFVNLYFYQINIPPYIGQNFYIETGLILFRERYIDYNESTTNLLYLNLYFAHRWEVNQKIFIYGGGGFSISPVGGIWTNLLLKSDFKLTEIFYFGIEIKQGIYFGTNTSKYFQYPSFSINLTFQL